tara:strand:- start:280 stop:966 length:687 start_codon:yes stop_codon:yes gene_type:complete
MSEKKFSEEVLKNTEKENEFNNKKYENLINNIKNINLNKDDNKKGRKEKLTTILKLIDDFKRTNNILTKLKSYTITPIKNLSYYVINSLECLLKDSYNDLIAEKDPTVKTTISIWPTEIPNSKNKFISNIDVKVKSDNFPYSSMDSVEGYIKQLVNNIEYIQYNNLDEDEKQQRKINGTDVKLLKPIKKEFTMFGTKQIEKQKENNKEGGKSRKRIKKNKRKTRKKST